MSQHPPDRFNPYENDPDRIDPNARTRRVERPPAPGEKRDQDWREMVAPNWRERRSQRAGGSGGAGAWPRSSADFIPWVARGGWKWLLGIAGLVIVLFLVLLLSGRPTTPEEQQPAAGGGPAPELSTPLPTGGIATPTVGDPAQAQPTAEVVPPPPGQVLVVTGTGVEGLFLRDRPGGTIVKTMPEGTQVQVIGPDEQGPDGAGVNRVWAHVREPGGTEGWAAKDFLQPAP